ncbi:hypothetical protein LDENG_00043230 [Lucifuga dentata]|nr:hypothetical protein LDENG_00043230 [Lucifuga dentata]
MENLQQRTHQTNKNGGFLSHHQIFGQGGAAFPHYRLVILSLGLLNAALLIVAIVIGINCAKVKENSLQAFSHASPLITELNNLRSNHSDVIQDEQEAQEALEREIKNHKDMKQQIEQKRSSNNGIFIQIDALRAVKTELQSNKTALDGSCGKCQPGWILHNSSCYLFSFLETRTRKNWHDSRADCIHRGADLVVIDDPEEQKFVSNGIRNVRSGRDMWGNGVWVGLTDIDTEGKWVWINNVTEVEPRYWIEGEPNNQGPQGEDCAVVVYRSYNPWKVRYDGRCNERILHWLCEMAAN